MQCEHNHLTGYSIIAYEHQNTNNWLMKLTEIMMMWFPDSMDCQQQMNAMLVFLLWSQQEHLLLF